MTNFGHGIGTGGPIKMGENQSNPNLFPEANYKDTAHFETSTLKLFFSFGQIRTLYHPIQPNMNQALGAQSEG